MTKLSGLDFISKFESKFYRRFFFNANTVIPFLLTIVSCKRCQIHIKYISKKKTFKWFNFFQILMEFIILRLYAELIHMFKLHRSSQHWCKNPLHILVKRTCNKTCFYAICQKII